MMNISELINKSKSGMPMDVDDAEFLYGVDPYSADAKQIMDAAYEMSQKASGGKAQIHAQIGLDASPCDRDCLFCSFASKSGLRVGTYELEMDQILSSVLGSIEEGANLVLMLTTATYEFEKLLKVVSQTREEIGPNYPILVGTDDFSYDQAIQLKEAGCNGAYHALRLGESVYTTIAMETRKSTIENSHAAGLKHCTCMEPIGPEHSPRELADQTMYILGSNPVFGGAWRRESIPESKHVLPMIDERQWALYAAVFRLMAGTRFPYTTSMVSESLALAGANLAWAEIGPNPREIVNSECPSVAMTVARAKEIFEKTGWELVEGPASEWMSDYDGPINRDLVTEGPVI